MAVARPLHWPPPGNSAHKPNLPEPNETLAMTMFPTQFVYPVASLVCATLGAAYDVRSRRIPNSVTFPAMLCGLLLHFALGGWRGLGSAFSAGLICGLTFFIFWLVGGMGAGDVKLIAAAGCLTGLPGTASLLLLTSLAGAAMAIGLALWKRRLKDTLCNVGSLLMYHRVAGLEPHPVLNIHNPHTIRLPYALAISAGCALAVYLQAVGR
jgi:prepilin peptidase CpaA